MAEPIINPYFDRVNSDILKLIPPDSRTILEFGCGAGALAKAYWRINPAAIWHGIEINQEAAEIARSRGVKVTIADLDNGISHSVDAFHPQAVECDPPDIMIFGDCLEHLRQPWQILKDAAEELAPGGLVIACIPNVSHWTIVRDLLKGQWRYTDEGLLDRTHLRFFTLEGVKALFADAGLHVFEVRGRMLGNEGIEEWAAAVLKSPPSPQMTAYQYIVRALKSPPAPVLVQPPSPEEIERFKDSFNEIYPGKLSPIHVKPSMEYFVPKLHIHAITAEECCARPRIREPFVALNTIPGVRCTIGPTVPVSPPPQIAIQQRCRAIDLENQRALIALGCIVIAEIDDLPGPPGGVFREDFRPPSLTSVHAIQASTEPLAAELRKYNPNVMVFLNQLAELPPWEDKVSAEVRIFFGAQNRMADWKPIMPALNRIIRDHQADYLTFHVIHDKAFYDALETGKKAFHPFLHYDQYISVLRGCDIALLPLEPTGFNEHKSDIKFLECAANGVAVLASETVYGQSIPICKEFKVEVRMARGMIYDSPRRFEGNLGILINHHEMRIAIARDAYAYVRDNRLLGQHYRKRHAWYLSLLADRERLHHELLERVPELKGAE